MGKPYDSTTATPKLECVREEEGEEKEPSRGGEEKVSEREVEPFWKKASNQMALEEGEERGREGKRGERGEKGD